MRAGRITHKCTAWPTASGTDGIRTANGRGIRRIAQFECRTQSASQPQPCPQCPPARRWSPTARSSRVSRGSESRSRTTRGRPKTNSSTSASRTGVVPNGRNRRWNARMLDRSGRCPASRGPAARTGRWRTGTGRRRTPPPARRTPSQAGRRGGQGQGEEVDVEVGQPLPVLGLARHPHLTTPAAGPARQYRRSGRRKLFRIAVSRNRKILSNGDLVGKAHFSPFFGGATPSFAPANDSYVHYDDPKGFTIRTAIRELHDRCPRPPGPIPHRGRAVHLTRSAPVPAAPPAPATRGARPGRPSRPPGC